MNKRNVNAMVFLVAAMAPLAASASVDEGLYVGGGLGVSHMSPATGGTIYTTDKEYDVGGKLYLGYDLNMDLSIEGYYSDLGSASMSPNGSIGYKDMGLNATYYVYTLGKGRQGLSVFIRGGVGRMQNDTSLPYTKEHNAHFMYGAGLEYGLGNGWAARADLDLYDRDAQMVTFGILKRFGSSPEPVITPPPQTPPPPEPVVVPEPPAPEPVVNPDSDGDGVPDASDTCPDTPPGTKVDATGCELKARLILQGVTFANNSSKLVGESDAILDKVASSLIRYPDLHIEVGGYTDSVGASKFNQKLSERRANAVRDYLISKGIAADHITAKGYGEESPVADNKTAEGRAQNRRVELKMLDAK